MMMMKLLSAVMLMVTFANAKNQNDIVANYKPYSLQVNSASTEKMTVIREAGATFLTVHFATFDLPAGARVVVRSPVDETERYEYTGKGRMNLGGNFFSGAVTGETAIVEYVPSSAGGVAEFSVDKISVGTKQLRESICGKDDSKPAKCYLDDQAIYKSSRAVARLLIAGRSLCTGWLVGCNNYFMTNQHCIENALDAANTDFEFMAESKSCEDQCQQQLKCKGKTVAVGAELVASDEDLDFALVKLNTTVDLSEYGYLQLREDRPAVVGEEIYIPQHPSGWAKRVSTHLDNGDKAVVTHLNISNSCGADQTGYMADTRGGSSGSPVLAASDHKVIAIHHCGGCQNTGVQMTKIVKFLGDNLPKCTAPTAAPTDAPTAAPTDAPVKCYMNHKFWQKDWGCQPKAHCKYNHKFWQKNYGCQPRGSF